MTTTINVIAAVVDTKNMILYKDDGDTYVIPQGDKRIQNILDNHLEALERGETVVIDTYAENDYQQMEENSSGMIKFFKTTKKAISRFFGGSESEESAEPIIAPVGTYGQKVDKQPASSKMREATKEIMREAKRPDGPLQDDETIVAIVGDIAIPGVENLEALIRHCNRLKDYKGLTALMKRVAAIIERRQHSMADLLRFLERSDMPIADDGSIIAYKTVRKARNSQGAFVDCHSGKVTQSVGSYVCMDPKLVDHNRGQECSNGLHVARRAYIGGFHGDVCLMIKVAPEDIIAVPNYDANKVRVCGYHILGVLSDQAYRKVRDNLPFTNLPDDQKLLQSAIEGRLPPPREKVEITGSKGSGLKTTKLDNRGITPIAVARAEGIPVAKGKETEVEPVRQKAVAIDSVEAVKQASVDPRDVQKRKTATKVASATKSAPEKASTPPPASARQIEAEALYNEMISAKSKSIEETNAAHKLLEFKKKKKVSWTKLGLSDSQGKDALAIVNAADSATSIKNGNGAAEPVKSKPAQKSKKKAVKPTPKTKAVKKALAEKPAKPKASAKQKKAPAPKAPERKTPMTREEEARDLFNRSKWADLADFKRKKKVSWGKLGFTPAEESTILNKTKK